MESYLYKNYREISRGSARWGGQAATHLRKGARGCVLY